ncbi:glycosyltransferase [Crossiella cryophila]|uniref:Glycosyltransferase involved in cell wall biosynthesis n=1 Tax=Crossiella cryophila TaxID=43355 RepID=A0A7W7CBZ4_9PSEU|nr:glycosyltransferase [Crossiella cryophila]MBB4678385.1 glycosyltransferase involved in cell wall biosynthesis [Crossiella cryophila]
MRLHLHGRRPAHAGDGESRTHRDTACFLLSHKGVVPHDLAAGPRCLAEVADGDLVLAGAHAFLYHRWRERLGREFRIVRQVHAALRADYWLQEELCAPLLRPGDLALFPTEYARRLYLRHFPATEPRAAAVSYPLLDRLDAFPPLPVPPMNTVLRVGFLGAHSAARNFDQVVGVFGRLHRETGGRARLVCAGRPDSPRWQENAVRARLADDWVPAAAVTMLGELAPDHLDALFGEIDVLLCPGTSSTDATGRAMLEALTAGVPVLAAGIGPAVELLPERNLLPTRLHADLKSTMDCPTQLGRVDEDALLHKLITRDFAPARITDPAPRQDAAFWKALTGPPATEPSRYDHRLPGLLRIGERATLSPATLDRAEQVCLAQLRGCRAELKNLLAESGLAPPRAAGTLPRLLNSLVLPPLPYSLPATA